LLSVDCFAHKLAAIATPSAPSLRDGSAIEHCCIEIASMNLAQDCARFCRKLRLMSTDESRSDGG
jgi:hypothetical protein